MNVQFTFLRLFVLGSVVAQVTNGQANVTQGKKCNKPSDQDLANLEELMQDSDQLPQTSPHVHQSSYDMLADKNGDGETTPDEFAEALSTCSGCADKVSMLVNGIHEWMTRDSQTLMKAVGVPNEGYDVKMKSTGRISKCRKQGVRSPASAMMERESTSSQKFSSKQEEGETTTPTPQFENSTPAHQTLEGDELFSLLDADGNGIISSDEMFNVIQGCAHCSDLLEELAEQIKNSNEKSLSAVQEKSDVSAVQEKPDDTWDDPPPLASRPEKKKKGSGWSKVRNLLLGTKQADGPSASRKPPRASSRQTPQNDREALLAAMKASIAGGKAAEADGRVEEMEWLDKNEEMESFRDLTSQSDKVPGWLKASREKFEQGETTYNVAGDDGTNGKGIIKRAARICEAEVSCVCQKYTCPVFCALKFNSDKKCLAGCNISNEGQLMDENSPAEMWKGDFESKLCGKFQVGGGREGGGGGSFDRELKAQLREHGIACIAQMRDPDNIRTGRRSRDWTLMETPSWRKLKETGQKGNCQSVVGNSQCSMPGFEEWKVACPDTEYRDIPCDDPYVKCAPGELETKVLIKSPSGGDDDCEGDQTVQDAICKSCRGITKIEIGEASTLSHKSDDFTLGGSAQVRDDFGCPVCCLDQKMFPSCRVGNAPPYYVGCAGWCNGHSCMNECQGDAADARAGKQKKLTNEEIWKEAKKIKYAKPKGPVSYKTPAETGPVPLSDLKDKANLPEGVDPSKRELYLSEAEFESVFKMTKKKFKRKPNFVQDRLKKKADLF